MRLISFILILATTSCLSGCDAIYHLLDKRGAEEKDLIGEMIPFEKNFTVQEIQELLNLYGYSVGRADGVLGGRTRDVIERFQKENGLELTRFVDNDTWAKLKMFKDNGFIVEGELNIVLIQQCLNEAGFDAGKADGKAGAKTKAAILAFQKAFGLTADGKVGYKTLTQLAEFLQ